jgi:hypothetical protein
VPEPPERVHWDSGLARGVGVPGAYDYGPERISWMGHLMTDWIGDHGRLLRLDVRVRSHNIVGDLTRCQGRVIDEQRDEAVPDPAALMVFVSPAAGGALGRIRTCAHGSGGRRSIP